MLIGVEKIEAVKPRVQQNDFKDTTIDENKNLVIANDRFKNRVRASEKVSAPFLFLPPCDTNINTSGRRKSG